MPAGFTVYNDAGIYQIDDTYRNMQLITKGSVTSMTYYVGASGGIEEGDYYWAATVSVTASMTGPILAVNGNPSQWVIAGPPSEYPAGTWNWRVFSDVDADFNWFCFERPTTGVLLEIRNSAGEVKFSAGNFPFKPIQLINTSAAEGTKTTTKTSGRAYAAVTVAQGVQGVGDSYIGDICTGEGAFCSQKMWAGGVKVDGHVIYTNSTAVLWRDLYISGGTFCGGSSGNADQKILLIDVTGA
jgi:hypothetical protein